MYVYICVCIHIHMCNYRHFTKNLDFRAFGSVRFLILRGGTPGAIGNFPEIRTKRCLACGAPLMCLCICMCMCISLCKYIYIYIYTHRGRERERERLQYNYTIVIIYYSINQGHFPAAEGRPYRWRRSSSVSWNEQPYCISNQRAVKMGPAPGTFELRQGILS